MEGDSCPLSETSDEQHCAKRVYVISYLQISAIVIAARRNTEGTIPRARPIKEDIAGVVHAGKGYEKHPQSWLL